jgi:hypothetical protein
MGYTHYFRKIKDPTEEQWSAITRAFKKLLKADPQPIQREYDRPSTPGIDAKRIIFNGVGDDGCETMLLGREGPGGQFCKTNREPYDRAVLALLILADHYAPGCWRISSDGDAEDWQPTLDWMNILFLDKFKLTAGIRP